MIVLQKMLCCKFKITAAFFAMLFYCPGVLAEVVVVNESVGRGVIDKNTLLSIFRMNKLSWSDGQQIKVFVLPPDNPVHARFSKKILNTLPHNLQRYWNRMVFSGAGEGPEMVWSENEMLMRVSSTAGSIGYVMDAGHVKSIKVLYVE